MTLAAYYYSLSKSAQQPNKKALLEIHAIEQNGVVHVLSSVYVSGIREAKIQAKISGATAWNF
jgi:hypothetical protein